MPPADSHVRYFGNRENVLRCLPDGLFEKALELDRFLVLQVDTNYSWHGNFGVPQSECGVASAPEIHVERVGRKMRAIIGEAGPAEYGGRLIFAICGRDIECWAALFVGGR